MLVSHLLFIPAGIRTAPGRLGYFRSLRGDGLPLAPLPKLPSGLKSLVVELRSDFVERKFDDNPVLIYWGLIFSNSRTVWVLCFCNQRRRAAGGGGSLDLKLSAWFGPVIEFMPLFVLGRISGPGTSLSGR